MLYRILADLIVLVHFGWIVFMVVGFFFTAWAVAAVYIFHCRNGWEQRFLDRWVLRTVHFAGIIYVTILAVMQEYCPLTSLENFLRYRHDPGTTYPGGFLIYYIERLVYPNLPFQTIMIPTVAIAVLSVLLYVLCPPKKIRRFFSWRS